MSYKIIPSIDLEKYQQRDGLEGPFNFNGQCLYYDPKEGRYLNPCTDFYLTHDEFMAVNV
jgi:hypothetical protein